MTLTKQSGPSSGKSGGVILWIALTLVLIGAAGLVWVLVFNQPESPAVVVATRTPKPTFTIVKQAMRPSATPVLSPVTSTPMPPTATQVPPTSTTVPLTATPKPTSLPPVPPQKP